MTRQIPEIVRVSGNCFTFICTFSKLVDKRWQFSGLRISLNASKPSEHPHSGGKLSEDLDGSIGCRDKNFMISKGFPNVVTSGQQYNVGEKAAVVLYISVINRHAWTPKPQSRNTFFKRSKPRFTIYLD